MMVVPPFIRPVPQPVMFANDGIQPLRERTTD